MRRAAMAPSSTLSRLLIWVVTVTLMLRTAEATDPCQSTVCECVAGVAECRVSFTEEMDGFSSAVDIHTVRVFAPVDGRCTQLFDKFPNAEHMLCYSNNIDFTKDNCMNVYALSPYRSSPAALAANQQIDTVKNHEPSNDTYCKLDCVACQLGCMLNMTAENSGLELESGRGDVKVSTDEAMYLLNENLDLKRRFCLPYSATRTNCLNLLDSDNLLKFMLCETVRTDPKFKLHYCGKCKAETTPRYQFSSDTTTSTTTRPTVSPSPSEFEVKYVKIGAVTLPVEPSRITKTTASTFTTVNVIDTPVTPTAPMTTYDTPAFSTPVMSETRTTPDSEHQQRRTDYSEAMDLFTWWNRGKPVGHMMLEFVAYVAIGVLIGSCYPRALATLKTCCLRCTRHVRLQFERRRENRRVLRDHRANQQRQQQPLHVDIGPPIVAHAAEAAAALAQDLLASPLASARPARHTYDQVPLTSTPTPSQYAAYQNVPTFKEQQRHHQLQQQQQQQQQPVATPVRPPLPPATGPVYRKGPAPKPPTDSPTAASVTSGSVKGRPPPRPPNKPATVITMRCKSCGHVAGDKADMFQHVWDSHPELLGVNLTQHTGVSSFVEDDGVFDTVSHTEGDAPNSPPLVAVAPNSPPHNTAAPNLPPHNTGGTVTPDLPPPTDDAAPIYANVVKRRNQKHSTPKEKKSRRTSLSTNMAGAMKRLFGAAPTVQLASSSAPPHHHFQQQQQKQQQPQQQEDHEWPDAPPPISGNANDSSLGVLDVKTLGADASGLLQDDVSEGGLGYASIKKGGGRQQKRYMDEATVRADDGINTTRL